MRSIASSLVGSPLNAEIGRHPPRRRLRARILECALLLLVLVIAAWFRFADLNTVPAGLYHDEAIYGFNALAVANGARPLYFGEREPLYMYVMALPLTLFGASVWVLRATSAIVGVLTVVATYGAGRALFGRWVGLIAASGVAMSLWHVVLSRDAFRAVTLPLFVAASVFCFTIAWRRNRPVWWAVAGLATGLTFYTYLASRFLLALALAFLLLQIILSRNDVLQRWRGLTLAVTVTAIVLLPLGAYMVRHPEALYGRPAQVALGTGTETAILRDLPENLRRVAGMFGQAGDQNWRHNLSGRPVFDQLSYGLFLIGLIALLSRPRHRPSQFVLLWLIVMLLPSALSNDSPHYLRTSGALAAVYLVFAIGLMVILTASDRLLFGNFLPGRRANDRNQITKYALGAIVVVGVLAIGGSSTIAAYFDEWRRSPEVAAAYNRDLRESASIIARDWSGGADAIVYLPSDRYPDRASLLFGLWPWPGGQLRPGGIPEGAPVFPVDDRRFLFVPDGSARRWHLTHEDGGRIADALRERPTRTVAFAGGGGAEPLTVVGPTSASPRPPALALDVGQAAGLTLIGADLPPPGQSGQSAPLALHWRIDGQVLVPLAVYVHLRDQGNQTLATADVRLGNLASWQTGPGHLITWHDLAVPPGLSSGEFSVIVGLYDPDTGTPHVPRESTKGSDISLGRWSIRGAPAAPESFKPAIRVDRDLGSEWTILGIDADSRPVSPGERRLVTVFVAARALEAKVDGLRLVVTDATGASTHLLPRGDELPTVTTGQAVRVDFDLTVPANTPAGLISIAVAAADGVEGVLDLEAIHIERSLVDPYPTVRLDARFAEPIEFIGYNLRDEVRVGQSITLDLFWRARGEIRTSYTVFIHLLDEKGNLRAQRDSLPQDGLRPTTGWLAGEVVADAASIAIASDFPSGTYSLAVGLYDARTGQRVLLADGRDHVKIPDLLVRP
jgi:4-amino-4-deoxy-L-arabinose transferase-like glycosyltransferase